eukprot:GHVU01013409.1.p2 GENE.GHVU01013409.1~~GHVU01013409.1.p2  ORF type:complete len:171 (+),score=7.73 GHVU01013409.1:72-584(+)
MLSESYHYKGHKLLRHSTFGSGSHHCSGRVNFLCCSSRFVAVAYGSRLPSSRSQLRNTHGPQTHSRHSTGAHNPQPPMLGPPRLSPLANCRSCSAHPGGATCLGDSRLVPVIHVLASLRRPSVRPPAAATCLHDSPSVSILQPTQLLAPLLHVRLQDEQLLLQQSGTLLL